MPGETTAYGKRLRDLEADAFRVGRVLAEHGEQLAAAQERQHTDCNPAIEKRLATIEHLLFALVRAQGINPTPTD